MQLEDFRDIEPGTRLKFFEPETCRAIREEIGVSFPPAPFRPEREHFFEAVASAMIYFEYIVDNEVMVTIEGNFQMGPSVTRSVMRRIHPEYIRGVL